MFTETGRHEEFLEADDEGKRAIIKEEREDAHLS